MKFNINDQVKVTKEFNMQCNGDDWVEKYAPEFKTRRVAYSPNPWRVYTIYASGPNPKDKNDTLYLIATKKNSSYVVLVSEQNLISVENIITEKENTNMKSESFTKNVSNRQAFANAIRVIKESAAKTGTTNAQELTLEQIVKRVSELVEKGDIVRIINPKKAVTDGDGYFTAALEKMVRYYPYMMPPRKNIKGEVIEIVSGKTEAVFAIKDYKNRIWLMNRSGIEIVSEV